MVLGARWRLVMEGFLVEDMSMDIPRTCDFLVARGVRIGVCA